MESAKWALRAVHGSSFMVHRRVWQLFVVQAMTEATWLTTTERRAWIE